MLIGCNRNIKKPSYNDAYICKTKSGFCLLFFFIIFFTCTFFFWKTACNYIHELPEREREGERERENFLLFCLRQRSLLKNSTTLKFHKNVNTDGKKESFSFPLKIWCFFFFFFSLAHKTSSNNKQITVITQLSAYTNLKLNIKSLKIINQTQDKADKPQAKKEKKKNP